MVQGFKGLENAIATQTRHTLKEDSLKVIGYIREHDWGVWCARLGSSEGTGRFKVALCDGAVGKTLARRLLDEATHSGRKRMESGRRTLITKRARHGGVAINWGAKDPKVPQEGALLATDFFRVTAEKVFHYNPATEPEGTKLEPQTICMGAEERETRFAKHVAGGCHYLA